MHGSGRWVYRGAYEHSKPHGRSVLTRPYGAHFNGKFVDNKRNGEDKYSYADFRDATYIGKLFLLVIYISIQRRHRSVFELSMFKLSVLDQRLPASVLEHSTP